jgi:dimeric dUTPase (all-alpha-NTP-PPase superfamily)
MKTQINTDNLKSMLKLQDKLNSVINPDWTQQSYPFLRAAFVESAEALEHHGWKWWKSQTADIYQLQIELVDILHFYLSDVLVKSEGNIATAARTIEEEIQETNILFDSKTYALFDMDILGLLELIGAMSACRRRSFAVLNELMQKCSLSWSEAYSRYVFKNVLNLFRQDNGYRSGDYIKIWDSEEDNVWLERISKTINIDSEDFPDQLRLGLERKYISIKNNQ